MANHKLLMITLMMIAYSKVSITGPCLLRDGMRAMLRGFTESLWNVQTKSFSLSASGCQCYRNFPLESIFCFTFHPHK